MASSPKQAIERRFENWKSNKACFAAAATKIFIGAVPLSVALI